jgi:Damage-control phosphatase ARMT1-like domain
VDEAKFGAITRAGHPAKPWTPKKNLFKAIHINMKTCEKPLLPLPEPLSGSVTGSFAYRTVTERLPRINREVLEENDFPPEIKARLEQLLSDLPNGAIRRLHDPGAPDAANWEGYVAPYLGDNWLQIPWFFAECYFYRRILEATGYFQAGSWLGVDPYLSQKQAVLAAAGPAIRKYSQELDKILMAVASDPEQRREDLHQLLVANVWGNQADLSMWSVQDERPDHQERDDQRAHLLVDDSERIADLLFGSSGEVQRVDFILDNYGLELAHDIGLADYLLSSRAARQVRFHLRAHPIFVSDAIPVDIQRMLGYLDELGDDFASRLAARVQEHLDSGRLELTSDFYWTSPLPMWEMPARVRQSLAQPSLVITKGDYNYRRLAGDRDWPPSTPFGAVVCYLQEPLLALRVLKAELALGLQPGEAEHLAHKDPEWLVNGHWAVIQYAPPGGGIF